MKVVCIDNNACGQEIDPTLKYGKVYNVLDIHYGDSKTCYQYNVLNDLDIREWFNSDRFISLEEHRNNQIDKII